MTPLTSLRQALADRRVLGVFGGNSWRAWRSLLIAAVGETLNAEERRLFAQITGREREPRQPVEELVAVVGRRGGKSRAISVLATYLAGLCDHSDSLARGERGVLLIIAPDQRQAAIVLDYVTANFENSPLLAQLIANRTSDTLELSNHVSVEVRAASFRRLRGPTYLAVIADEAAFWHSEESSNPDVEILNAVRPGLATTGGPLIIISSPYSRRGVLWDSFRRHFGPQGDPLIVVAQGASRTFNRTLPQSVVDRALERDANSASAEYLAQFRRDIESYIALEAVQACMSPDRRERPPVPNVSYLAFVDPSGGANDAYAMAIAHRDDQQVCLDAVREVRPPFSPESVTAEFAQLCRSYRITRIHGDRYAGLWPVEQFRKHGIRYEQSAKPKSDLYRDLLPLINSRQVDLLDHARLVNQLIGLERRTSRAGKDSIDHAPNTHDDLANCVAGALTSAHTAHRQRIRCGVTGGYGASGPITWDAQPDDGPQVRWVKISESEAPASRGP